MTPIAPRLAAVRPRVVCPVTGEAVLLDEAVRDWLSERGRGVIEIVGRPGAGKTTALEHLAAVLEGTGGVILLDDADLYEPEIEAPAIQAAAEDETLIYSRNLPLGKSIAAFTGIADAVPRVSLPLSAWTVDERIEYLLNVHPKECRSVMARLKAADDCPLIAGWPELWRLVLDRMASNPTLCDLHTTLAREIDQRLKNETTRELARGFYLATLARDERGKNGPLQAWRLSPERQAMAGLCRYPCVELLLTAEALVTAFARERPSEYLLCRDMAPELVRESARFVKANPRAMASLVRIVSGPLPVLHSMAASILHQTDTAWKPRSPPPCLKNARLEGADWPGIDLSGGDLRRADLSHAELTRANLRQVEAGGSRFAGAILSFATMADFYGSYSEFQDADLTDVVADRVFFNFADLSGATLNRAMLNGAELCNADLRGAQFRLAKLCGADLRDANIEGADFFGAELHHANLSGLPLRQAQFAGAGFIGAWLDECDLEGLELPDADFSLAFLNNALLTDTVMPRASFAKASLNGACLGGVEWEGANLNGADLRGATFHLGSSRSGRVGSTLASEGTRTGFYTDEFDAQGFKSPEEIRVANLCGADLRDANTADVDFYLVDLRRARYSPQQADHFRRCGAILVSKSSLGNAD